MPLHNKTKVNKTALKNTIVKKFTQYLGFPTSLFVLCHLQQKYVYRSTSSGKVITKRSQNHKHF